MKWHTEKRKISDLIFTEHNPQTQTEKQKKDLSKSIDKFDLVEIPAINMDGQILAGHKRIAELIERGRKNEIIDVRVPDKKLSKKECDEYLIRSNKNHGEWDFEKLNKKFDLPDLEEWGFEKWEFDGLSKSTDDDDVQTDPDLPEYLTFIVTPAERVKIEKRLDKCDGNNRTEQLLNLCKK